MSPARTLFVILVLCSSPAAASPPTNMPLGVPRSLTDAQPWSPDEMLRPELALPFKKAPPAGYDLADLGTLGGSGSFAHAIDDRGAVVGESRYTDVTFYFHGFVWRDGEFTDLGTFGGGSSAAYDINRRGQAVGYSQFTPFSNAHACLWEDGQMIDLGALSVDHSFAWAINDHGAVAGWSWLFGPTHLTYHACLWRKGTLTDLGSLEGDDGTSQGWDINDHGQVVGGSSTGGAVHPFLWDDGVMTDLGSLGGAGSALGVNDRGQVVGGSEIVAGLPHAFLWEDGVMRDLGTLGGARSYATDINDRGQVVGRSETASGETHAFLWEDGVMVDLEGGPAGNAEAINRWGQATGFGLVDGGDYHALFWEPESKSSSHADVSASSARTGVEDRALRLLSAAGTTPVEFALPSWADGSHVIRVFDARGRRVAGWAGAASRAGVWDGRSDDGAVAAPGIYFLQVSDGARRAQLHLVVLR